MDPRTSSPYLLFVIERPPGVPFQKIQFGTDRAAGVLFYLTPGAAYRENLGPLRSLILRLSVTGFFKIFDSVSHVHFDSDCKCSEVTPPLSVKI